MQTFDIAIWNEDTGERWGLWIESPDPVSALQRVLRRKRVCELLMSEQTFRFVVSDTHGDELARAEIGKR